MKFVPTQTERTIFLWLVLAFMAMLVPQCWWTTRWSGNGFVCGAWMLMFAGLLLMTSVIAGTKRQVGVWFVAMLSLAIAYWFSPTPQPFGVSNYWYHLGAEATGLVNSTEAIVRLAAICFAVFVASFIFSLPLDRFVGPVNGVPKERKRSEPENAPAAADDGEQKSSGRIRLLVIVAAILFFVQAASNLVGVNSGAGNIGQMYLLPIVSGLIPVICCGAICRLRRLPAFCVGVVTTIAMSAAGVAIAVQNGAGAQGTFLVSTIVFCSAVLTTAFVLLGNSRQSFQVAKFGWLLVVTVALAVAIPIMSSKYDLHCLLLTSPQFDFEEAAFQKELNSYPGVNVGFQRASGWSQGTLDFDFTADAEDSFFNDFDASRLSDSSFRLHLSGLKRGFDLSNVKSCNARQLHFARCELTTEQLAEVARLEIPIEFSDCSFIEGELRGPAPAFVEDVMFWSTKPSMLAQFIDATNAFGFESKFKVFNDVGFSDGELDSLLDLVERTSEGASVFVNSIGNEIDIDRLTKRKNLDRFEIVNADFTTRGKPESSSRVYFAFLLKTEAKIQGRVDPNESFWDLCVGAKGELRPLGFQGIMNYGPLLNSIEREDCPFVYKSTEAGEVEKLWLPQCDDDAVSKVCELNSLKAVSFDVGWLGNETIGGHATFSVPTKIQAVPLLNALTNLEELYFSGTELVDLALLSDLKKLKTIQFASSNVGFSRDLFPDLKEARIVLDTPIKNGLMKELNGIDSLERLMVIDIHTTNFSQDQFLRQARALFGDQVEILVVDREDAKRLAPVEFELHREKVRQRCIEKYLK